MAEEQKNYKRESSKRVFAGEFRQTKFTQKFSDEEKAATFILTPTGEIASRVFIMGVMPDKERAGDKDIYYKAKVTDPTGSFFITAGKYQPSAMMQMARIETPCYVAIVGKPRVFTREDGGIFVSINAESVSTVTREIYNIWILETAKLTADRIAAMEKGDSPSLNNIKERYTTNLDTYKSMVNAAITR
jgi:uncharacterized protein